MFDPVHDSIEANGKQQRTEESTTDSSPETNNTPTPAQEDDMKLNDEETQPLDSNYLRSYFNDNLEQIFKFQDSQILPRSMLHYSLFRKLLLVKTPIFPNVLELFQMEYVEKKKKAYETVRHNYSYEPAIGETVVQQDLRYFLKTEHIGYMTFLIYTLVSSKSVTKTCKDRLISDPYYSFALLFQLYLYNFNILNKFSTFSYNILAGSSHKKFFPVMDIDVDLDKDLNYPHRSPNFQFKPEYAEMNDLDPRKDRNNADKKIIIEWNKAAEMIAGVAFGNAKTHEERLQEHPQVNKLNGFQVFEALNDWCKSNGEKDPHKLSILIYDFINLLNKLGVRMKRENQIVALILWMTAIISYSQEHDHEFQESILMMIFNDPSFQNFDYMDYNVPYTETEINVLQAECDARTASKPSKAINKRSPTILYFDEDYNIQIKHLKDPSSKVRAPKPKVEVDNSVDEIETSMVSEANDLPNAELDELDLEGSIMRPEMFHDAKHMFNDRSTKSKNNYIKQLDFESEHKLGDLYKDQTIDQLVHDLDQSHRIASLLRKDSQNYIKLFDKYDFNYVSVTSGKFGERVKKNPKYNDSLVGFQTDMVKLFRMSKKMIIKKAYKHNGSAST
ncbi:unnamed protein product [Hanseniaspora opuntiae]